MDRGEALARVEGARVARLATADAAGVPHVVPVVFALVGETAYWAVDRKPKRSDRLRRLDNIRENPNVELLADHYEDDWTRLWWVRASGTARILPPSAERDRALALLARKYAQYREMPPQGTVVAIDIGKVTAWEHSP